MQNPTSSPDPAIAQKIDRIRRGACPRVLDLFAGCGGISLGFKSAGFDIAAAIELDESAARTHGMNFHPGDDRFQRARDITTTDPSEFCEELGLGRPAEAFDVIVGGPPCQAFARIGRAKLREVARHPAAFLEDPRAQLYRSYLDHVKMLRPLALLIENVPDVLNHGGQNLPEQICDVLDDLGYIAAFTLLNAVFYGVPQMRDRMFLVAYRKELPVERPRFPSPTHHHVLPSGYEGTRAVALKLVKQQLAGTHAYSEPSPSGGQLENAVTAREAIGDLPAIDARDELRAGRLRRGARRLDVVTMPYDDLRQVSDYAREMKTWPGFEAPSGGLSDHQIRYLPRDYELFARMREGAEYPELHAMATARFERTAQAEGLTAGSPEWEQLRREMVPPYDPAKFPNKWWKLVSDEPVRTLTAHLGKDSYSHIHYDSAQARTISVREAARLQSFPDGFRFAGAMNAALRQIGNAVPPLLGRAIAQEVLGQMMDACQTPHRGRPVAAE